MCDYYNISNYVVVVIMAELVIILIKLTTLLKNPNIQHC